MGWLESRIRMAEQRLEYLYRLLQDLIAQVRALQQGLMAAQQQGSMPTSGGVPCWFIPASGMAAASGNAPSGTPTSLTNQTVYRLSGGSWQTVTSSATVYNPIPSALASGKMAAILKNVDGTYSAITQSCN